MSNLLGILLFAVGIGVSIGLHEWGHMQTARWCGMVVRRFFIGFGPSVLSFRRKGTEYGFKLLPLGGFCDIAGMTPADEVDPAYEERAMWRKPWWQRIIVLSGGIIMNLILGTLVTIFVALRWGLPGTDIPTNAPVEATTCVSATYYADGTKSDCSGRGPAAEAGIQPGDLIVGVDDIRTDKFAEVREYLREHPGATVTMHVQRDGQELDLPLTVAAATVVGDTDKDSDGDSNKTDAANTEASNETTIGLIGVTLQSTSPYREFDSAGQAVGAALGFSGNMITGSAAALVELPAKIPGVVKSIFGAERDASSPISVVGAARIGGELAEHSQWPVFLLMLANLNFFLAIFNLVPLPPLDGGHMAVVFYETIRNFIRRLMGKPKGAPVDYRALMPITVVMAGLLLLLGISTITADIFNPIRLFR